MFPKMENTMWNIRIQHITICYGKHKFEIGKSGLLSWINGQLPIMVQTSEPWWDDGSVRFKDGIDASKKMVNVHGFKGSLQETIDFPVTYWRFL